MAKIIFDKEKCVKCGKCVKDCIAYSIEIGDDGFPRITTDGANRCISCQHCFSICPTGAITIDAKTSQEAYAINLANPEDILGLIKSRRSIRQYKQEEISQELFEKIKRMLPYIPTGCNYNSLHFSIVESSSAMNNIREYVRKKLLKIISNKFTEKYAGKFKKYQTAFENGEDVIFRDAPHMIVVSSSIHAPCANVDPIIALSYIELYAQSLGLGTCWCGFAQACFKLMPKLSKLVEIPDGYKPVYVMLIGYPAVNYARTTLPEEFPISVINDFEESEMNWSQRLRRILLNFIR